MPKKRIERVVRNEERKDLCTQSYYARMVGKSPSTINQMIEYGHLETVTVLGGLRLIKLT